MVLGKGAMTGITTEGNPYEGDFQKGIEYDQNEVDFPVVVRKGDTCFISNLYRAGASRLAEYVRTTCDHQGLEIGAGTGISTLEILSKNKLRKLFAVEMSKGMISVAKYKFNQSDGSELLNPGTNINLLKYWEEFRKESRPYSKQVTFMVQRFEDTDFPEEVMDFAIANQSIHWMDLNQIFLKLRKFLKKDASLWWNTASHFYNDSQFPSFKFGARYNDFLKYVLEELNHDFEVGDLYSVSKPIYDLTSLQEISSKNGFQTKQLGIHIPFFDLQFFVTHHIPSIVNQLTKTDDREKLESRLKEAIAKTINNPQALKDTRHKYDVNPIFCSTKL
ncbi:MAG: class I SAM-dependent methyltransferase [Nanoarchaeota archaeon]|nr:class I SAM-dependent methyltransferase [Nanoarchaeota archaeon]